MKTVFRKAKLYSILAGIIFCAQQSVAQDIHFSQFYEISMLRNPALTGLMSDDYRVGVNYRSQWSSISNPFNTALLTAEAHRAIGKDFISAGVTAYYDKSGSINLQTIVIAPAIAYNKSLEDDHNSYLSVGLMGGYIQRSFDPAKATFDNQYQNDRFQSTLPSGETFSSPSFSQLDFGGGVSFSSSTGAENKVSYIVGLSGYHLTQPMNSFYKNGSITSKMRINASASVSVKVNDEFNYQLHLNYMRQGSYNELIFGGLLGWNLSDYNGDRIFGLYAGAFYRYADAIAPVIKLRYKTYSFGFSYDLNVSSLKTASNLQGGYEITVFKTGLFKDPNIQRSRTLCPHNFW